MTAKDVYDQIIDNYEWWLSCNFLLGQNCIELFKYRISRLYLKLWKFGIITT